MLVEYIRTMLPKSKVDLHVLSDKILKTLLNLKSIDEYLFSVWYEQKGSKKKALESLVLLDSFFLLNLIEKEFDKKSPALGSSFMFWTGKMDDLENYTISFTVGISSMNDNLQNRIVLSFPLSEKMRIDSNDDMIKKITKTFEDVWNVSDSKILIK